MLSPDVDIILLTLGEGGGTGSGVAPVVAETIKELGRTCVAIVTIPFETESVKSKVNAAVGIDMLYRSEGTNAIICIENDKLTAYYPDRLLTEAYEKVNEIAVSTFLNLIDLANLPSKADRIDESELKSIFKYPGFATLANFRTQANLVEDVAATLRRSWNGSLFAEINPASAAGVIFGIEGPTHLFTTTQVDAIRRTFHEILAGKDVMLGIYPSEHLRWASYIGILTGLDIPKKIHGLLDKAKTEYQQHEKTIEAKIRSKREGLGFSLKTSTVHEKLTRPTTHREFEKPFKSVPITEGIHFDLSREVPKVIRAIEQYKGETLTHEELINLIQNETDIEDEKSIAKVILELQNLGFLAEVRKNVYRIV
jgi:cell division GTPase FtsZ